MLKLATVFSGIGAVEHALKRMGIDYEIVFASDNGDVDILSKKIKADIDEIKNAFADLHNQINDELSEGNHSDEFTDILNKAQILDNEFVQLTDNLFFDISDKKCLKQLRECAEKLSMLYERFNTEKIHDHLSKISDYKAKKEYVDNLYESREKQNKVKASYFANYEIDNE